MTAALQPSDVEARIRELLNREIRLAARMHTFEALLQEIIGRIGDEIWELQTQRLALEDQRIAAVEVEYEGKSE